MPAPRGDQHCHRFADLVIPVFAPQVSDFGHLGDTGLEEDVKPVDPLVFIETETKEESNMATVIKAAKEQTANAAVKVKVKSPFRVLHEGKPFTGGDVAEVPGATAQTWIASGWAEPVPQKGTK